MLSGLEAINLQSFNWLKAIPADFLVLSNAVSWPLDASHSCHKCLCKAAPWNYSSCSQEQNLPNQYQFSSWQPSSNGQKTTLMLFLCSCLFAFTGWGSSRPFVGWSWCLFQLNPLSWMKNLYLSYTKKNKNLQNCSYVACSHQMSLRIFEWVLITLRSWSYAVVSFAKFSKCSKNQQCWFRENALFDI